MSKHYLSFTVQSASGLIRQPQAQLKAQTKVGSERSREFSLLLSFDGQKNGVAILRVFENKQPKKVKLSVSDTIRKQHKV